MSSLWKSKGGERQPAGEPETVCFSLVLLGLQPHTTALRDDSRPRCRLINPVVKCIISFCLSNKPKCETKKAVGFKTTRADTVIHYCF